MLESRQDCGQSTAEKLDRDGRFPLSPRDWQAIGDSLRFSMRERQVVRCVFAGRTESEIAGHLGLSSHTIHSYLDRLYRKLKVNSRCELVVRVFEEYIAIHTAGGSKNAAALVKFDRHA